MSLNQQGACAATELMLNVYKPSKCTLNTRKQLLSDRNDRGKQKLWKTCSMDCWKQSGDLQNSFYPGRLNHSLERGIRCLI